MRSNSLTRRTIVIVLSVELLCAIAFSGTALWHESRTRMRAFDIQLAGRSDSLLGAVQDAEDPQADVTIDPVELHLPAADVYAVYNRGGRLLGSSAQAPQVLIRRGRDGFSNRIADGRHYRVLQSEGLRVIDRLEHHGSGVRKPVTILYAARTDHIWHEVLEAAGFYIGLSLALLCVTGIILIVLLRRLLRPIRDLGDAAAAVDAASLSFDPPTSALELRELRPLADTLSATVARLRHAFDMEHRFVSDAAHELKTAVAVLRSTVQVLTMRPRSVEEYQAGLDQILTDNERVEALITRMLTLARFEEQRGAIAPVPLNFSDSVERAVSTLKNFAMNRDVRLSTSVAPGIYLTLSEEAAEVLISNLVVNAVQHSPGGTEVLVTVGSGTESRTAVLEVRDNGSGVAAESLPHVFERFFREDRSRSRATGGAGLGLAICRSIVEAAGGVIRMESVPGRGTTVRASFSLA
ncbi:MAG TPA: HAMP domain-containing sensor histidine kinase [Acidobacteriaceae bacterium]|jgi:signal transduction histidine kinase|nr:HAMP domain-containing sensor histidine kinase [Acidobacteriaceae bacterium]